MMSEEKDTVTIDMEGSSGEDELPEVASVDDVDSDEEADDNTELTGSSHRPWSFEYYQGFFDVDTDQVLSRIRHSFIPTSSFMSVVGRKPDLYGPFWICMTLALSITISGNIAALFEQTGSYAWQYDFTHLSFAITAIYSYVWVVPALLWAWLWWRGIKGKSATLLALICVYGYSLAIFVPSSMLYTIPNRPVRWLIVMLSMLLSGAVLFRTFWPLIAKKDKKLAVPTLAAILILHAALSVGFVLYFFPVGRVASTTAATTAVPATAFPALPERTFHSPTTNATHSPPTTKLIPSTPPKGNLPAPTDKLKLPAGAPGAVQN